MSEKSRSIQKGLFRLSFKSHLLNKNDVVEYPDLKKSKKSDSENGKSKSMETNNGQITLKIVWRTIMAKVEVRNIVRRPIRTKIWRRRTTMLRQRIALLLEVPRKCIINVAEYLEASQVLRSPCNSWWTLHACKMKDPLVKSMEFLEG